MKHEYVDASDLIQTDMRSGNEKKLDAMLDERGANEMGAETAVVLRNIALELMAQLEQDEKTRPASDADMAVYRGIAANYHKDKADLTQQDAQAELPIIGQNKLLADALASCILASGIVRTDIDGLTGPQLLLFAEDLREMLETKKAQQDAQAVPVVWMGKMDFEALKLRGRVTATLYGEPVGNKTHEVGLCLATPTPPCRRNNHD